jgi:hypothetical protein
LSEDDANKVFRQIMPLIWVVAIGSLALALGSMLAYVGPFAWFAELQLKTMGSYSETTTFVATLVVIVPVVYFLARPFTHLLARQEQSVVGASSFSIAAYRIPLIIGCAGLLIVVWSATDYYRAAHAGALTSLDLAKLEGGQPPRSGWVTTAGRALLQDAISFGKVGSEDLFVPISSPNRKGDVHLFVKSPHDRQFNGGVARGMLHRKDLPGPVRISMEKAGLLHGGDYYVLDTEEEPAMELSVSMTFIEIGGAILAFGMIAAAVTHFRRKKSVL